MCMEQKEETANEHVPPIASEPMQSFRSLLADALMAATPLPVMLFCAWLVRDENSFPEFPFIILGGLSVGGGDNCCHRMAHAAVHGFGLAPHAELLRFKCLVVAERSLSCGVLDCGGRRKR